MQMVGLYTTECYRPYTVSSLSPANFILSDEWMLDFLLLAIIFLHQHSSVYTCPNDKLLNCQDLVGMVRPKGQIIEHSFQYKEQVLIHPVPIVYTWACKQIRAN